jgi:hypothetical protein
MKKLAIIVLVVLLSNCAPKIYPRRDIARLIDFRPYTEKGFMITTETYTEEYEPVGVVSYKIIPKCYTYEKKSLLESNFGCDIIPSSELLDSLYFMSKKLGANGIMNFWYREGEVGAYNMREAFTISAGGFAIIRK